MASIITLVAGEHPQTDAVWQEARADAHRRGSLFAAAAINLWYGFTLLLRGELAEARAELETALGRIRGLGLRVGRAALRADVPRADAARAGRGGRGARACSSAAASRPTSPPTAPATGSSTRLALELAEGQPEDGVATAERIARDYPDVLNPVINPWRALAAEAHDRLGDRERGARPRAREEVELARRWGAPGAIGRALRVLGTLERERRPRAPAARPSRCSPARPRGSSTRRRSPRSARRCAARAGRPTPASRCAARSSSPTPAAPPALAEDVRSELYATGARPRSTARERRRLAHRGRAARRQPRRRGPDATATSRRRLFVTPKTVEVHLEQRLPQARHQLAPRARDRARADGAAPRALGVRRKTGGRVRGSPSMRREGRRRRSWRTWTTRP